MKSKIIFILVMAMLFGMLFYILDDDPSIHTATYEQLCDIKGIDVTLANRILSYLKLNPEADIDDLDDVYGIGEYRLKLIKEVYD